MSCVYVSSIKKTGFTSHWFEQIYKHFKDSIYLHNKKGIFNCEVFFFLNLVQRCFTSVQKTNIIVVI